MDTTELHVKFKDSGNVQKIPKSWAELQSSRKPQVRTKHTTGMEKRPVGKVRDTALKDKARGKLAAGRVLVYSYGDEMYRKVAARTLIPFTPQALERPYGKMSIEAALKSFNKRGISVRAATFRYISSPYE